MNDTTYTIHLTLRETSEGWVCSGPGLVEIRDNSEDAVTAAKQSARGLLSLPATGVTFEVHAS